jgi:hypothetical protein
MPVVLMRNLNQWMGLCNRTRLLITRLADYVLEVTDMTSSSSGINKQTFSLGLNKHIGTSRAMRNNTERGDCKEQQLCMEFIDSKKSFTKRDIRKKTKRACTWGRRHAQLPSEPACQLHSKHISTTPHYMHRPPLSATSLIAQRKSILIHRTQC